MLVGFLLSLIFEPNWLYSLCMVSIFATFKNAITSKILAVFSSRFLAYSKSNVLVEFFLAFLSFDPN